MQLSRQADYGLLAIGFLSRAPKRQPQSINQIAEGAALPREFLAKILMRLNKAGLLVSKLGVTGGYVLARRPREISYRAVIEALNGPIHLNLCTESQHRDCPVDDACGFHDFWVEQETRLLTALDKKRFRSGPRAVKER